jgi:hypothetical protein
MEDGKSQTWFKYTSMVVKEFHFDFIVKVDSDTLVFMPTFLSYASRKLRNHKERVYGGAAMYEDSCDPNVTEEHACPLPLVGSLYMSGELYWMSPDLADFITSPHVDRNSLMIRHEDVDIGNFVYSHPKSIRDVKMPLDRVLRDRRFDAKWRHKPETFTNTLWGHSLRSSGGYFNKNLFYFRKMWRQYQAYWDSPRRQKVCTGSPLENWNAIC